MILSRKLSVADPVYADLSRIKAERIAELGRQVTFSEVLADLIRHWEATVLVRDAKAGGQWPAS